MHRLKDGVPRFGCVLAFFLLSTVIRAQTFTSLGSFNGHSYHLSDQSANFNGLRQAASFLGNQIGQVSYLASINSEEEDNFLKSKLGSLLGPEYYIWIGFSDELVEGQWQWESGEEVTYTGWDIGEPDSGQGRFEEDYAAYGFSTNKWHDFPFVGPGFEGTRGVIEVVPEPATIAALLFGLGVCACRRRNS